MAVAKRELGRTSLQVTTLGYGAMELRGAPRARDITEAQAETCPRWPRGAGGAPTRHPHLLAR